MQKDHPAELMAAARKKCQASFMGFVSPKFDEAGELYTQAANAFKLNKQFVDSARAFTESAECFLKCGSKHDAATALINACNMYRKEPNKTEAVHCLERAAAIYAEDGRFTMAAKHFKEIGELLEKDGDQEHAIDAYQRSADLYEGENQQSSANQCLLQVALLSAQLQRYDKAIAVYDQVATGCLDNTLIRFSFRDYAFRALLCHLANSDLVSVHRALDKYRGMDNSFASSREAKLIDDLCRAVEAYDTEAFTNAVAEFDSITRLDDWKSSLLLRSKDSIKAQEGASLT